jgi:predicted transcriptional regulator
MRDTYRAEGHMRTKGAFGYDEEDENKLLEQVDVLPQTTNKIAEKFKGVYAEIHYRTVERLLERLWRRGEVKKQEIGRITLWSR